MMSAATETEGPEMPAETYVAVYAMEVLGKGS